MKTFVANFGHEASFDSIHHTTFEIGTETEAEASSEIQEHDTAKAHNCPSEIAVSPKASKGDSDKSRQNNNNGTVHLIGGVIG